MRHFGWLRFPSTPPAVTLRPANQGQPACIANRRSGGSGAHAKRHYAVSEHPGETASQNFYVASSVTQQRSFETENSAHDREFKPFRAATDHKV